MTRTADGGTRLLRGHHMFRPGILEQIRLIHVAPQNVSRVLIHRLLVLVVALEKDQPGLDGLGTHVFRVAAEDLAHAGPCDVWAVEDDEAQGDMRERGGRFVGGCGALTDDAGCFGEGVV